MNTTVDEVIQVIHRAMLSWGHHNAPGCLCCIQASMIIEEIIRELNGRRGVRVEGDVIIDGPKS
jgi:hypothetical protein